MLLFPMSNLFLDLVVNCFVLGTSEDWCICVPGSLLIFIPPCLLCSPASFAPKVCVYLCTEADFGGKGGCKQPAHFNNLH